MTVAIACTDYLQAALVRPLVTALRQLAPGVRVAIRNLDVAQLEPQMARGDVDLALMTPGVAPAGLRARPLFEEHYVLIARHGHPVVREGITVEEFATLEHIVVSLRGGRFATPVDDALAGLGRRRNVVFSAASFLVVPDLVAHSDLVALVPSRLVSRADGKLLQVQPPLPVEGFAVGMVWHERCHGHEGQRWVRETLRRLVATG